MGKRAPIGSYKLLLHSKEFHEWDNHWQLEIARGGRVYAVEVSSQGLEEFKSPGGEFLLLVTKQAYQRATGPQCCLAAPFSKVFPPSFILAFFLQFN